MGTHRANVVISHRTKRYYAVNVDAYERSGFPSFLKTASFFLVPTSERLWFRNSRVGLFGIVTVKIYTICNLLNAKRGFEILFLFHYFPLASTRNNNVF